MKVKITSLGVNLHYPYGPNGPYETLRRYIVEAEDGRIDIIEEWNEEAMPSGEYDIPDEAVDKIFNREVEVDDKEASICHA